MEGSGDIFLDSVNVSDGGNKEKHYGLNIRMDGGPGSKVYLGFTSSTARTAFLEGTVSGTGTLVFENTSRSRVSNFDLTARTWAVSRRGPGGGAAFQPLLRGV